MLKIYRRLYLCPWTKPLAKFWYWIKFQSPVKITEE